VSALDPRIVETGDSGKPFVLEFSNSESVKAFDEIVSEIVKSVNKEK